MEKYIPKNKCPKCTKIIWDYNDAKPDIKCDCGEIIHKNHHDLIGGIISKEGNNFTLTFPEYKEKYSYPDWANLEKELDRLTANTPDIKVP